MYVCIYVQLQRALYSFAMMKNFFPLFQGYSIVEKKLRIELLISIGFFQRKKTVKQGDTVNGGGGVCQRKWIST